jgi:hypothetical protein
MEIGGNCLREILFDSLQVLRTRARGNGPAFQPADRSGLAGRYRIHLRAIHATLRLSIAGIPIPLCKQQGLPGKYHSKMVFLPG